MLCVVTSVLLCSVTHTTAPPLQTLLFALLPNAALYAPNKTLLLFFPVISCHRTMNSPSELHCTATKPLNHTALNHSVPFCTVLHCTYRYESIIATLCENLEDLDEPEVRERRR